MKNLRIIFQGMDNGQNGVECEDNEKIYIPPAVFTRNPNRNGSNAVYAGLPDDIA